MITSLMKFCPCSKTRHCSAAEKIESGLVTPLGDGEAIVTHCSGRTALSPEKKGAESSFCLSETLRGHH